MAPKTRPLDRAAESLRSYRDKPLYAAFLARGVDALESLAEHLDTYEMQAAVSAPTLAATLLSALSRPSAVELLVANDPLADARLKGVARRAELLSAEGGTLTSEELAAHLQISRQAVDKRRLAGKLLAVDVGRRGYRYPAWQLVDDGMLPGLEDVLGLLARHPPLARVRFFLSGSSRLNGESPLARLRRGELASVVRAARAFGEQGAG